MHKFVVYIHWVLTNAYTHVAPIKIYITITPKFPHVPSSSLKSECIFPQMIKFKNKTDFLLSKMKEKKKACFTSPNITKFCRYIPGISLWIIVSSTERKSRMVVKILEPDRLGLNPSSFPYQQCDISMYLLCLSFLLWKMEVIIIPSSKGRSEG